MLIDYRACRARLLSLARAHRLPMADAEDLAQDSLEQLFRDEAAGDAPANDGNLEGYLRLTIRGRIMNARRRHERRYLVKGGQELIQDQESTIRDPESIVRARELLRRTRAFCVDSDVKAAVLRGYGLNLAEIAEKWCGTSTTTVHNAIERGRRVLLGETPVRVGGRSFRASARPLHKTSKKAAGIRRENSAA